MSKHRGMVTVGPLLPSLVAADEAGRRGKEAQFATKIRSWIGYMVSLGVPAGILVTKPSTCVGQSAGSEMASVMGTSRKDGRGAVGLGRRALCRPASVLWR